MFRKIMFFLVYFLRDIYSFNANESAKIEKQNK